MVAAVRKGQRGVSVIEVVIAFFILGIVAVSAFAGDISGLAQVGRSFEESAAVHFLSGRLDALRSKQWTLVMGESDIAIDAELAGTWKDVECKQHVVLVEPGLFETRVEMSWVLKNSRGRRKLALTTLIARETQ